MISRRSRLKAVANLPVRRKFPLQGNNDEVIASDSTLSEKNPSCCVKAVGLIEPLINASQDTEARKSIPAGDLQSSDCGNKQDIVVSCASDATSKYNNFSETSEKFEKLNNFFESEGVDILGNNIYTNSEKHSLNSFEISRNIAELRSDKHVESCLKEIAQLEVSQKFSEGQSFLAEITYNSTDNHNLIKEGVKCYTVLNTDELVETSVSGITITALSPCETNTVIKGVNTQNQEFEEGQIYTELVEPTELFGNIPAFVNNEIVNSEIISNSDFSFNPEESEIVLTNVVGKNADEKVDKAVNSNGTISNTSYLKNISQEIFVKPTAKNRNDNSKFIIIRSEEFSRNSETPVTDKAILGNAITPVSQNNTSDSHSVNERVKRSISTLKRKRSKCSDFTKKLADARREFQKKYEKTKPDHSTLKMIDLIFYNPTTNPMESKNKLEKRESSPLQRELIEQMLGEEGVDEPEPVDCTLRLQSNDDNETENINKMPVPQVKIGLNGEIILDEKSLIIETTDAKKGREDLQNSIPVFEDKRSKVSYYRGKPRKTRDWTDFETKRFYKALNTIGPDFSLMQKYFPKRSRLELKNKFKREERLNRNLIDKALNNPSEFDMTQLEKDLAVERKAEEEVEMRSCKGVTKHLTKKPRIKSSLLSREMIESNGESDCSNLNSEEVNSKNLSQNEKNKKKKEISFIFQKFILRESEKQINELQKISESSTDVFQPANNYIRNC